MQKTIRKPNIGKLLLLAWSALCIGVFIYFPGGTSHIYSSSLTNLPLLVEQIQRLDFILYAKDLILSLLGMLSFFISCTSLGAFILKLFDFDNTFKASTIIGKLASLGTKFLMGHGVFSLIFMTLGELHRLIPAYVVPILAVGTLLGFTHLVNFVISLHGDISIKKSFDSTTSINRIIYVLAMAILGLGLLSTAARISYDSTTIYFSDAKITALTGRIQYFTDDTFVASVFHTAVEYTVMIQLFGDQSARMFSWLSGVIIIVFGLAIGEKVGLSRKSRIVLFAMMMTSTAFIDLLGDGKVDLISTAPAIAAIYWMVVQSQNTISQKTWFLLTGFLVGLSIVARPFNAFLLIIFTLLFYLRQTTLRNGSVFSRFKFFINSLFWIGAGAIGLGIYHLFANWMILGNALGFLSSISKINQANGPWDADPNQLLALRLLYPIVTTFRNTPQSLGNISPMVIAFLPALFIPNIRKSLKISSELGGLSVISAVTLLIWIFSVFTVVEIRYVMFLWIILFMPVAKIISNILEDEDTVFKTIGAGTVFVLLAFIIFRMVFMSLSTYSPLDRQGNPQCYDFFLCNYLRSINDEASSGDRILTLSAYRYYLRTDLFACSTTHEEYDILQELSYKNPEDFWVEVYRQGYQYIAYENDYTTRHLEFGFIPDLQNTPDWISLERIDKSPTDLVTAFKVNIVGDAPVAREKYCIKNNGVWLVQKIDNTK